MSWRAEPFVGSAWWRCRYGQAAQGAELLTIEPELTCTGATIVEPMIVGPTTELICPIAGPLNERSAPQEGDDVPPVGPASELLFVEQPVVPAAWEALPAAAPPAVLKG